MDSILPCPSSYQVVLNRSFRPSQKTLHKKCDTVRIPTDLTSKLTKITNKFIQT